MSVSRLSSHVCRFSLFTSTFDKLKDIDDKKLPAIDPAVAYVENFVSIKERESFWTRLKYTMGKRVKEEVRSEQAGSQ